jgi:dihydroorotase
VNQLPRDLDLLGGNVLNPQLESFSVGEVKIRHGRIVTGLPDSSPGNDTKLIDLSDLYVSPGLVDLHAHVFNGQDLGVNPDTELPKAGVTTVIDAGSAGGHLFGAFRKLVIEPSHIRIRAFLNIASIGTTSILLQGELKTPAYCNEDLAYECALQNNDVVMGIKVRASNDVGGELAYEGLMKARRVANRLNLPLMVHLGPAPVEIDTILEQLKAGDVLTHAFTGWKDNQLVSHGEPRESYKRARARGVFFDIGHGKGGFDSTVAKTMIENGALPDSISTDLHTYSKSVVGSLPEVMSKFLALGMSIGEVFSRVTSNPAKIAGLSFEGVGTLENGASGDVAAFEILDEHIDFDDCHGHTFSGSRRIVPVFVVADGVVLFDRDNRSK